MIKVHILFGEGVVKAFYSDDMEQYFKDPSNCNGLDYSLVEREFECVSEINAYIQGIHDMSGWRDYKVIGEDDYKDILMT